MLTAEQLRMARAALRLTVKALAGLAGVDEGTIIRIEAGKKSYKRTLKDLRGTLEEQGIVFLEAQEGMHRPGVALGWDVEFDKDGKTSDTTIGTSGEGLDARAWDEDFDDLASVQPVAPYIIPARPGHHGISIYGDDDTEEVTRRAIAGGQFGRLCDGGPTARGPRKDIRRAGSTPVIIVPMGADGDGVPINVNVVAKELVLTTITGGQFGRLGPVGPAASGADKDVS